MVEAIGGNFRGFIQSQDNAIYHTTMAIRYLFVLMNNIALDIHDIKKAIKMALEEDMRVERGGSSKPVQVEEVKLKGLQAQINKDVRRVSDTFGALTREY